MGILKFDFCMLGGYCIFMQGGVCEQLVFIPPWFGFNFNLLVVGLI